MAHSSSTDYVVNISWVTVSLTVLRSVRCVRWAVAAGFGTLRKKVGRSRACSGTLTVSLTRPPSMLARNAGSSRRGVWREAGTLTLSLARPPSVLARSAGSSRRGVSHEAFLVVLYRLQLGCPHAEALSRYLTTPEIPLLVSRLSFKKKEGVIRPLRTL